jgi:hypothetical protein
VSQLLDDQLLDRVLRGDDPPRPGVAVLHDLVVLAVASCVLGNVTR